MARSTNEAGDRPKAGSTRALRDPVLPAPESPALEGPTAHASSSPPRASEARSASSKGSKRNLLVTVKARSASDPLRPLAAADVLLKVRRGRKTKVERRAKTNARGQATFRALTVGRRYTVEVKHPSYATKRRLTAIKKVKGRTIKLAVELWAPKLQIAGVEVIQVIQRFNARGSGSNNSVRLAAGHRTVARVYVTSGEMNGSRVLPDVTGRLRVHAPSGASLASGPLNKGGVVTARALRKIKRDRLEQTLNFELPAGALTGNVTLEAEVWLKGRENMQAPGWKASSSDTVVTFHPRRQLTIAPIRIDAEVGKGERETPPASSVDVSIEGARRRFPVAADGILIHMLPGLSVIKTNHKLSKDEAWRDLLDDINEITAPAGVVKAALVPDVDKYASNGIAFSPGTAMVARAKLPATFAHELSHACGAGHANRGDNVKGIDPRLPKDGRTEDLGMDVKARFLVPKKTAELMSYAIPVWPSRLRKPTYQDRWPSIALWNILFDALA